MTTAVQPFSLGGVAAAALIHGNDHRPSGVSSVDVQEMCLYYMGVEEPVLERNVPGELHLFFNHIAYEQFEHQLSPREPVGRTLPLLVDHSPGVKHAPTEADWLAALGAPIEQYMRVGFAMHIAALSNGGVIDRTTLQMDHVRPIFSPLPVEDALDLVHPSISTST